MDALSALLGRNGFLPHGYCFTWSPGLLWSMVAADALVALSYFSIPVALVFFIKRRADIQFKGVALLFSAFIFACGLTHLMDIWTIWNPDYVLHAITKVVTAGISVVTAAALWPLMPTALKIPSVAKLREVIQSLEAEIAKRRSAEEQLAEIQQSLAVTLSSIGAGFLATDRVGRVTRMNSVAEQILGWTEAQAVGQSYWQVFQREGRTPEDESRNPVDWIVEQGLSVDTARHVTALARDGRRTAIELKAAPTRADDGSVSGMAVVFRDLTEQMRAEAESARLAAIVESSNDAIIGKTLDGRITNWNRAAETLFGYRAEEAIGQSIQMLIPPGREPEEMRAITELARGERVPLFDTVRRAKDGSLLEVSVSISPIRDARGRIVGASKIARDVGRQRRAEAALRDSEARLRLTLEAAQAGDWDMDLATGEIHRSLRHDLCFGYTELQPRWNFEIFLAHVHAEDRPALQRQFDTARVGEWSAECRVVWPDNSLHWISLHGNVGLESGRPTRLLGIVIDITEAKQAEHARLTAQRLQAENRQIQEANRLKSQFLANMSHELRTPLNSIIGFADLLHRGSVPAASPKHQEFLGHIANSGRHLLQLINDVLDLSKVESGKFEFFPEPLDLPQLVKDVRDVMDTAIVDKQIDFAAEIDPSLTGLVLDPARLKQVLYNYLSNAIKFTPQGGRVVVRALPEGSKRLRIEVEDTGIGIAESDLSRLFSEFQQLDAGYGKRHQGTGLGLALTRRLVQAQGGSVGVRSTPGAGSVFHLVLDRVQGEVPSQRLLVIAPRGAQQDRMVAGLGEAGFVVDVATSGAQAVQQAHTQRYSGIALALQLPDQSGLQTLADIREGAGASREAPVVGVTVPAGPSGAGGTFPVADVLCKPLRAAEVVAAMTRLRAAGAGRRVMLSDHDPHASDLMRATLEGLGLEVLVVPPGRALLDEIEAQRPDALVFDPATPAGDSFALLDALQRLPAGRQLPLFLWTDPTRGAAAWAGPAGSAQSRIDNDDGGSDDRLGSMLDNLRRWHDSEVTA